MAAVSDKARFYLEQLIPELKEYEQKRIFSKVSCRLAIATVLTNKS
jgi:hypothetical protein